MARLFNLLPAAATIASLAVVLCSFFLAGCSASQLASPKDVVLLDSMATIGPRQSPIRLNPPLTSDGELSICLVLASGIQYDNRAEVDAKYQEMMRGAKPVALLLRSDGKSYRFTKSNQGWTKYGRVTSGGELSNCLAAEAESVPRGVEIVSIEVRSDIPLKVLGVYWSSVQPL